MHNYSRLSEWHPCNHRVIIGERRGETQSQGRRCDNESRSLRNVIAEFGS